MKGRNIFTFIQPQIIPMMMPGLFTLFSCQVVSNPMTPDCSTTGSSVAHCLLELAQIHVHWVRYTLYFILRCPLLLLTSVFPNSSVFSNESTLSNRWPKIRASASASVLPINIQVWFPLGLTGLISLHFKGLSRISSMRQALRPGALGRPRGSGWRGWWEGGSGWGTHVNPWLFHFNVWQNSLQINK